MHAAPISKRRTLVHIFTAVENKNKGLALTREHLQPNNVYIYRKAETFKSNEKFLWGLRTECKGLSDTEVADYFVLLRLCTVLLHFWSVCTQTFMGTKKLSALMLFVPVWSLLVLYLTTYHLALLGTA